MSFRHKSSLSRHTKTHMKVTKCQLCEKSFRFDTFLKKHMLAVHGIPISSDEPIPEIIMEVSEKDESYVDSKETIIIYTQEAFDSGQQQPEC